MKRAVYFLRSVYHRLAKEFNSLGHNIKTYVLYGVLYDIMFNLYKPYAPKFAERLGGTELHLALLTSLPGFFAVIALIPCSILLTKADKRKATAFLFAFARSFLVLMALTPFLPQKYRAWAFVIALSVMNLPDAISQASLQSFLGDLFHPRQRADAIVVRNRMGNLATSAAIILSCLALSFVASTNNEKIVLYQIFYVIAFLFGVMEVIAFLRLRPKKGLVQSVPFSFHKSFPDIIRDKKFVTFCLIMLAFHFSYFMAFPLANVIQLKKLGATELWVGVSAFVSVTAIVAASRFWSRMITKKGTGTVLSLSAAGLAINLLLIGIAPNPSVYAMFSFFGGWFTCGLNLSVLNGLLESTPDTGRVVYVGVFQTFVNFTLAAAPLFAHLVSVNTSVYTALAVAGTLRLVCAALIFAIYRKKPVEV